MKPCSGRLGISPLTPRLHPSVAPNHGCLIAASRQAGEKAAPIWEASALSRFSTSFLHPALQPGGYFSWQLRAFSLPPLRPKSPCRTRPGLGCYSLALKARAGILEEPLVSLAGWGGSDIWRGDAALPAPCPRACPARQAGENHGRSVRRPDSFLTSGNCFPATTLLSSELLAKAICSPSIFISWILSAG